jgi:hypothetical protein
MTINTPKALLICGSPIGMSFLSARLKKCGCEVYFASSCKEAYALVDNQRFDLVLSEFRLSDGSPYPLASSLVGSRTTVVYSYPVETGCWWLPAVMNGQCCWGSLAMQASEFVAYLDDILIGIVSRRPMNSDEFRKPLVKTAAK